MILCFRAAVLDSVADFLLFLCKLCVVGGMGIYNYEFAVTFCFVELEVHCVKVCRFFFHNSLISIVSLFVKKKTII